MPKALRKNVPKVIPTMVIGRLAVDVKHRGNGLGAGLVRHAILRALEAADIAGIKLMIVHTQTTQAAAFWCHHEFDSMPDQPDHLILTIRDAQGVG